MATNATYILTNGKEVKTLKEALMSGQGYTMRYTPVEPPQPKMTEAQKQRRIELGS